MTIDNGSTNFSAVEDEKAIENGTLPGTNVSSRSSYANRYYGSDNRVNSDNPVQNVVQVVDVAAKPGPTLLETLGQGELTVIQSLSKKIAARNLELSVQEAGFNKTAWIMENGEPFCNHCDSNFIPAVVGAKMACTNCGCGRPADDHGLEDDDFGGMDMVLGMTDCNTLDTAAEVAGNPGTEMIDGDMIKTMSRLASTEDYLEVFKTANSSDLYVRGYMDAMNGKPLDVELAEVSDDYFHGYEQYSFYHTPIQQHVAPDLHDIKPNSNQIPRRDDDTTGVANEAVGPMQLTQDREYSVANKLPFPVDVVEKFFEA